ncbi:uncharacterized protein LOC128393964 [Panonychus citri]|uniref:uncharacterized protein LOC128393964 n=1 Tax=Panonychus citri TaxID=50023 RepID=UPI00230737AD|nr:uncharacterized protein LOC128393964 [Panonychus citri]XP_053210173.1 uncharacterized protein LOC128393964 [Panonychus citri]
MESKIMDGNYLGCDGSHGESAGSHSDYSDSECYSELDSNLEWIQENCDSRGNLFYLQILRRDSIVNLERPSEIEPSEAEGSDIFSPFRKLPKIKSSYSKFRHWVTGERRVKSSLKESIKKSWLKKGAKVHQSSSSPTVHKDISGENQETIGGSVKFPNAPRIGIENEPKTKDFLFNLVKEGLNTKSEDQDKIFTLMYLASPNDNSSNDKDYAVLIYPPIQQVSGDNQDAEGKDNFSNDSGLNNWQKIIKLKGMFVSLSQVINDITGQLPIVSSVDVRSKLESLTTKREDIKAFKSNDKTFIVAYAQEFNSALILCFPEENYKQLEIISMISSLSRLFRFLYNSLDAAFKNCDNHPKILHYLSIFHYLLSESNSKGPSLCFHFDMIQRLIIEDDLLLGLDEALSEYESMDWFSDCCFGENGEISSSCDLLIVGSALFYKGFLISSHLPGHYLSDVISFIKYRGIISLIKQQPIKMVIWQEVFPLTEKNDPMITDFKENDGTRFFLLVVAVEQTLLCTLLEIPFLCDDSKTKPNELIINQTLRFVASTFNRSGLIQELNQHLNAQSYLFNNTWTGESHPSDRLRQSISARELAGIGVKDDEISSCDDDHWSEHSSIPSNPLNKSLSSPSIPQVQNSSILVHHHPNQQQSSTSIHHTLPPPLHHPFPPAPATSLSSTSASSLDRNNCSLPNELTVDSNSCSHSIPSCIDYYSQDLSFPDYLLFYIDMDLNSRTFCGPVVNDLFRSTLSPNLSRTLRTVAIYLSEKLNKYYPGLTEIGDHFTYKDTFLGPNVRFKNKKSADGELNLWVVGRKETPSREMFLFFRVPSKGRKSNSFLPTESLFNRLSVQNK